MHLFSIRAQNIDTRSAQACAVLQRGLRNTGQLFWVSNANLLSFHNIVIENIDYVHTAVKYGVTPLLSVCEQKQTFRQWQLNLYWTKYAMLPTTGLRCSILIDFDSSLSLCLSLSQLWFWCFKCLTMIQQIFHHEICSVRLIHKLLWGTLTCDQSAGQMFFVQVYRIMSKYYESQL